MMRHGILRLLAAVTGTFVIIAGIGWLLCGVWAPVISPGRHVVFELAMFAVTGATVVAAIIVWMGGRPGGMGTKG